MKTNFTLKIFTFLFALNSLQALALQFYSRNMPRTCHFVFEVESDLLVKSHPTNYASPVLYWATYNVYEANEEETPWHWHEEGVQGAWNPQTKEWEFRWSFMSFATSEQRLNRHVLFIIQDPTQNSNSATIYYTEFGRQFAEACHQRGRVDTPWRQRTLSIYSAGY